MEPQTHRAKWIVWGIIIIILVVALVWLIKGDQTSQVIAPQLNQPQQSVAAGDKTAALQQELGGIDVGDPATELQATDKDINSL